MAIKKALGLAAILFVGAIFLAGCNTLKGVATGVGATAEGAAEDVKGAYNGIKKADDWIRKNLW
ncbi:MAG: hypothetical protein AABY28_04240 [Candidatus Omnitrophota bacterium]